MSTLDPRHPGLVHALLAGAERGADGPRVVFAGDRSDDETSWRGDELVTAATRSASVLADLGVTAGDRVLLCLPTGPEFATAFLGAVLLGAVPTATATPGGFGAAGLFAARFSRLVGYLEPTAVVGTETALAAAALPDHLPTLTGTALHALALDPATPTRSPRLPAGGDTAFIQATSGSTGTPKGVRITHANLAANCEQIARVASLGADDFWVTWLPLHHDMGLIGGFLTPMFCGAGATLMPPSRFLRRPGDWLRQVSRWHGTITAAPNFAFGYTAGRVTDAELDGVELSSWRFLFCGAEPIHLPTVQSFVERFTRWGLPGDALVPCYGMAEASLAVTVAEPARPLAFDTVSRRAMAEDGVVVDTEAADPDATPVVDCGPPVPGTEVRIVGDDGSVLGADRVGRIQFRGPSTTPGYFRLPEVTAQARFDGDWWDTGDLGYLRAGRLRITGRVKDLVIIRGANHVPSDFEQAAAEVAGVRPGGVVAVGHSGAAGSEELHLIVETDRDLARWDELRRAVRVAVSKRTGVLPADVVVVTPHTIPKTTSGKVQRALAKQLLLEPVPEPTR